MTQPVSHPPLHDEESAITYVFRSLAASNWQQRGLDEDTRDLAPTRRLLAALGLPGKGREYVVITGSKGKGSTAAITAHLLRALGHRVGLVTGPHLTTYRQRFRIDGRMIDEATLVQLINTMRPAIDSVIAALKPGAYLSPQGIFLALALAWFDAHDVSVAVIEVGRGGRYDDNALVPNMLSLFTPMMLEHTRYLGPTLERIAWHKAGIIKPRSYAYSLPQPPEAMAVLQAEAAAHEARFDWLAATDIARHIAPLHYGQRVDFGRYGVVEFPLLGHYQLANASLAIWGTGNVHGRLQRALSHGSPAYVESIRQGLASVQWPGRLQQLEDRPAVFVDGAIHPPSAASFLASIQHRLTQPVVSVLAVPSDRNVAEVYRIMAEASDALILTQTRRNITIRFPDEAEARRIAAPLHPRIFWADDVAQAIDQARAQAGPDGTVLLALAQPAVGDVMAYYGLTFEQI